MTSRLFRRIEQLQGDGWGDVLDAGTGVTSAQWLSTLPFASLTLVTASQAHADQVRAQADPQGRARLLVGNWADPQFLPQARFDTVIADYLVGAVDRFAPYFQNGLMARLARMTRGRLYVVGVEPYVTGQAASPEAALVREIGRFRDACLLLSGEPPFREYPAAWVVEELARCGLRVIEAGGFPIRYKPGFVESQIAMALMRLDGLPDPGLAAALRARGEALRAAALRHAQANGGLACGHDYVIAAEPIR